jgi:L-threonylcarbamoyladenylate synthase
MARLKMATLILPTTLPTRLPLDSLTTASLTTACAILQQGGLVAFPTETVYGLGASALSEAAVRSIYTAKGRPSDNPLIVHVGSREMLHDLIPGGHEGVPQLYEPLLARFWPGPLSLIFPLASTSTLAPPRRQVANSVTAGLPSLAVRMPAHPLSLALIRQSDLPLAAPSANLSSRPSPTTAEHVKEDLGTGRGVGAILDGGPCEVGVESTVIDFVPSSEEGGLGEVRVLRAGGVSAEELEECLREAGFGKGGPGRRGSVKVYQKDFTSSEMEEAPTTPGMKYKHYSPTNSRVVLVRPIPASSSTSSSSLPTLVDLLRITPAPATDPPRPRVVGLMLTTETLTLISPSSLLSTLPCTPFDLPHLCAPHTTLLSYSLGSSSRPLEAAQRLFAGLRYLDGAGEAEGVSRGVGVDLIMVECVEERGVGEAVMERARKAAGGGSEMQFRV